MNGQYHYGFRHLMKQVRTVVNDQGATLVTLEVHRGRETLIRVVIDHPLGTTLGLCQEVMRHLQSKLGWIESSLGPFRLEVTSPGVERILRRPREFRWAVGRRVCVVQKEHSLPGQEIHATLIHAGAEGIQLAIQDQPHPLFLPWSRVAKVRLESSPA